MLFRTPIFSSESGTAAFYAAVLTPIVFCLSIVALDVSSWNSIRDSLQQEADRIAFQAAQFLPDGNRALVFIQTQQNIGGTQGARVEPFLTTDNDLSIGVRITFRYVPAFSQFLPDKGRDLFLITRLAIAEIVPTDYVLVIADGSSLRPGVNYATGEFDEPWGSAADWPASGYLTSCVSSAPDENLIESISWNWAAHWEQPAFKRWLTQSCFNEVLTPLKLSAIGLVDSISSSLGNRVSVIFTPSSASPGFSVVRHIHGQQVIAGNTFFNSNVGGFFGGEEPKLQAQWIDYRELDGFFGDRACVLFSDMKTDFGGRYALPEPSPNSAVPPGSSAVEMPPCGSSHSAADAIFGNYFHSHLLLREQIYWHAAVMPEDGPREPQIIPALEKAWEELVNSPQPVLESERAVRGNLAGSALRRTIVFTDSLPDLGIAAEAQRFTTLLRAYASAHAEILILTFRHPGTRQTFLIDQASRLRSIKQTLLANGVIEDRTIEIVEAQSAQELQTRIMPKLLAYGRQIALRR